MGSASTACVAEGMLGPVTTVAEGLAAVRDRIARAASQAGRPATRLIAVSKGQSASAVREAYAAGQRDFGENYAQELAAKAAELTDLADLRWHFIGHLQRNKVKEVLRAASVIHTVDRDELAREIDKRADRTIEVLIEVNIGGEAQKGGCAPSEAVARARAILGLPRLRLRGLMAVPPAADDPQASRPFLRALRELAHRLEEDLPLGSPLELSMGMSHDLEVALEEGATMVRVGTSIFGARAGKPA